MSRKSPFPYYDGPRVLPTIYVRPTRQQDLRGLEFYQVHGRAMTLEERFRSEESLEELVGLKDGRDGCAAIGAAPACTPEELQAFYERRDELASRMKRRPAA